MKKPKPAPKGRPAASQFVWPVYSSQSACSSATKIPLSVLRAASKAGSSAFDSHGRIHLGRLLEWFFSRDGMDNENWGDRLKRAQALREEGKLEEDRKAVIDRLEVANLNKERVGEAIHILERKFVHDLPAAAKGLDETAIAKLCREYLSDTLDKLTSLSFEHAKTE